MSKKILLILSLVQTCFLLNAQNYQKALDAADITNFSVNGKGGWQLYNSCLTPIGKDSVLIELILQHDINIDWESEHEVGKIKTNSFLPKNDQDVYFKLIENRYKLRIEQSGKCFLTVLDALPDNANPAIIPVRVKYKLTKPDSTNE